MSYKTGAGGALNRRQDRRIQQTRSKNNQQDVRLAFLERVSLPSDEEITLSSGQTVVDLSGVWADATTRFFVYSLNADGGSLPLSAYTVIDDQTIELKQSYPEGTILFW